MTAAKQPRLWPFVLLVLFVIGVLIQIFEDDSSIMDDYDRRSAERRSTEAETIRQCKASGKEWKWVQVPHPQTGVMNEYGYRCVTPGATQARP